MPTNQGEVVFCNTQTFNVLKNLNAIGQKADIPAFVNPLSLRSVGTMKQ